ncbi:MAG: DUF1223 domain-containing protein [Pseudomonadota bacterium]
MTQVKTMARVGKTLLVSAIGLFALANTTHALTVTEPKAVVELFTSQGCHSCPPADKVLGDFSKSEEILGLGWHVDYWDYLGWKDSFASRDNTNRQYAYSVTLNERQVYTPQAVINGRTHAVGSYKDRILDVISGFNSQGKGLSSQISVTSKGEGLNIVVPAGAVEENVTLFMVSYSPEERVKINHGENAGKFLTYHNVVHNSQVLGLVKPTGFNMDFPIGEITKYGQDGCALILQRMDSNGNPGPILGAVILSDL